MTPDYRVGLAVALPPALQPFVVIAAAEIDRLVAFSAQAPSAAPIIKGQPCPKLYP
jgi:hypothetical protein